MEACSACGGGAVGSGGVNAPDMDTSAVARAARRSESDIFWMLAFFETTV